MLTPADLFLSLVISSIAAGYLLYGRRQGNGAALISGVALLLLPYLVGGSAARILLSAVLMALPWLLRQR